MSTKDSQWLQLDVCREYQKNKCPHSSDECKYAHPPDYVNVENGKVMACFDSFKERCQRVSPLCKYFHPPAHLIEQITSRGRNNLAIKNSLYHQIPMMPTLIPIQSEAIAASSSTQSIETGIKRPAEFTDYQVDLMYPMFFKRQALDNIHVPIMSAPQAFPPLMTFPTQAPPILTTECKQTNI